MFGGSLKVGKAKDAEDSYTPQCP